MTDNEHPPLVARDDEERAWAELKSVLKDRIAQALDDEIALRSFDQIVDEELNGAASSLPEVSL